MCTNSHLAATPLHVKIFHKTDDIDFNTFLTLNKLRNNIVGLARYQISPNCALHSRDMTFGT